MSITVNSGKKIEYAESVLNLVARIANQNQAVVTDLFNVASITKMAATDRAYNHVAEMANDTNVVLGDLASAIETILEELKKRSAVGPALTTMATRVLGLVAEAKAPLKDLMIIPKTTIDGRGLEEKWGPSEQATFADIANKFMAVRLDFITSLSDITKRKSEEDFAEMYMTMGRHIEKHTNSLVGRNNALVAAFAELGIDLSKSANRMNDVANSIKGVEHTGEKVNLAGEVLNV